MSDYFSRPKTLKWLSSNDPTRSKTCENMQQRPKTSENARKRPKFQMFKMFKFFQFFFSSLLAIRKRRSRRSRGRRRRRTIDDRPGDRSTTDTTTTDTTTARRRRRPRGDANFFPEIFLDKKSDILPGGPHSFDVCAGQTRRLRHVSACLWDQKIAKLV